MKKNNELSENDKKRIGRDLSKEDEKGLGILGLKRTNIHIFNFYRKNKILICSDCEKVLRKSVNLVKGLFKTPLEDTKNYCKQKYCKNCLYRTKHLF